MVGSNTSIKNINANNSPRDLLFLFPIGFIKKNLPEVDSESKYIC